MSLIIFKDQKTSDKINQLTCNIAKEQQKTLSTYGIMCHNSCDECAVCFQGPHVDDETKMIEPFIKHHITYFPQKIAYVHIECHKKIHATDNHFLIQYDKGDSNIFHGNLKSLSKTNQGSMYR